MEIDKIVKLCKTSSLSCVGKNKNKRVIHKPLIHSCGMIGFSSQNSERNLVQLELYNTHAFSAFERQGLEDIIIYILFLYRTY